MKPRNVVLVQTESGEESIKIVDFGISRSFEMLDSQPVLPDPQDLTDTDGKTSPSAQTVAGMTPLPNTGSVGLLAGTPPYMSPEQCAGLRLDARSDMYSLGCMLYEMLTGHVPFGGDTADVIMDAHLTAPVPPLRLRPPLTSISPSLEQLILRLLAKSPSLRFSSMQEVEQLLQREVDLLGIDRGEMVLWSREQLRRFMDSQNRWRKPQVGNSVLLRKMVATIIAMISVRFGLYMRPVIPPLAPLPKPPQIEGVYPRSVSTACRSLRRSDTAKASASPADGTFQRPAPPEK